MVGYGVIVTFQELKIGNTTCLMRENILLKPNKERHCLAIQALLGNTAKLNNPSITHICCPQSTELPGQFSIYLIVKCNWKSMFNTLYTVVKDVKKEEAVVADNTGAGSKTLPLQ